jgi:predicted acetyltransferase
MQNEEYIICRNDETKVDQVMEERENPSLQTEISRNLKVCEKIDEEKIKHILEQLQFQRKKWCLHNKNVLCWYFYCVNDNSKVNLDVLQMIHCLLCHS